MPDFTPQVDANRLFSAADALLNAIGSDNGMDSLMLMSAADRHVGVPADGVFTRAELLDAMDLLIRMGFDGFEGRPDAARH